MKSYILITNLNDGSVRKYATLTAACRMLELPYHSLKGKKLPVVWKNYRIERIRLNFERDYLTSAIVIIGVAYFITITLIGKL